MYNLLTLYLILFSFINEDLTQSGVLVMEEMKHSFNSNAVEIGNAEEYTCFFLLSVFNNLSILVHLNATCHTVTGRKSDLLVMNVI